MRGAVVPGLAVLLATGSARADEPAYPAYPGFEPGEAVAADQAIYSLLFVEELEAAPLASGVPLELEGFWRIGDSYHSFWLDFEGEGDIPEGEGEAEVRALYSRVVSAYFDVQVGVRADVGFGDDDVMARPQLVVGAEGRAPNFFELEPAVFVSIEGDVAARLEASYDLLITQRLVLTPDLETNLAVQEVEEWDTGSGLSDLELGARLRYEIIREVAPYVGITWVRKFAGTADFAEAAGDPVSETRFVAGARLWW